MRLLVLDAGCLRKQRLRVKWLLCLGLCLGMSGAGRAVAATAATAAQPAALDYTDRADGISCSYFDVGLGLPWPAGKPSFADDLGSPSSSLHIAESLDPKDPHRVRRIDVTPLVLAWWQDKIPNDGFLVRLTEGSPVSFHAREDPDLVLRPQLKLSFAGAGTRYLEAAADAALDCSTYTGLGTAPTLLLHGGSPLALRFELERHRKSHAVPPQKAELVLVRKADTAAPRSILRVSRLVSPLREPPVRATGGIAKRYPGDQHIGSDPEVFFADPFEARLSSAWTVGEKGAAAIVPESGEGAMRALQGQSIKVVIEKGQNLGLDLRYKFAGKGAGKGAGKSASEPEEAYFRYYLWLDPGWLRAADGGKLPGFAATYNKTAWGGRPWDGQVGWSLRGFYGIAPLAQGPTGTHPAAGKVMLGTYAYHSKADRLYGEGLPWSEGALAGLIQPGRWVCIEQHLKLNTPGREDGVLRVWVDGVQVFGRHNLRLRDRPAIRIEEVWMNFYHGGTALAPAQMTAYVDQLVIARSYIGPIARP